jgi:hypothetical protein
MSIKKVAGGFGVALRRRRIETGFTQEELAERARMNARGETHILAPSVGWRTRFTLTGADRLMFDHCVDPEPHQVICRLVIVGSAEELLELQRRRLT